MCPNEHIKEMFLSEAIFVGKHPYYKNSVSNRANLISSVYLRMCVVLQFVFSLSCMFSYHHFFFVNQVGRGKKL